MRMSNKLVCHDFSPDPAVQKLQGLRKAFLDAGLEAPAVYTSDFLYNDPAKGSKVFCALEKELASCSSFWISAAFITSGGVQLFKPVLRELKKNNIQGRILTTDYLAFSDPEALDFLCSFENIEVRMYQCADAPGGFHTKGYWFEHPEGIRLVVGSSNLTDSALLTNEEWNADLFMDAEGAFALEAKERFESLFFCEHSVPYPLIREEYEKLHALCRKQQSMALRQQKKDFEQFALRPNSMQIAFIDQIRKLLDKHETRGLLVSATGTGKTYAAAFAVREFMPRRILFLVHREQIAARALESFKRVIGDARTYGLVSGTHHETDRDYLFATVQTFSRESMLKQFTPDAFEFIIIDEVHRAAAPSYKKIFAWFKPKFWLGMSATPVRTDHESIYDLFDHNVALNISLREALERDLLCPFHYYALTDLRIDQETAEDPAQFVRLLDEERIRHILKEARYYGYSGDRVKGLIFVSSNKEAAALSEKLNAHGLRTLALSGQSSQEERADAISRLVQEKNDDSALDYLLTVDIFNEGVDIPDINQILLLRPTQSAIVFVQQLGRGLRKAKGKDYVVVLDFIGLYANNYMIPQALSGSQDGSKESLRRFVTGGTSLLPGLSTVHFDPIARKSIFDSIDSAQLNSAKALREGFLSLKEELGRIPDLTDFEARQAMDPMMIFSNGSYPSYPDFLRKMLPKDVLPEYSELELEYLRFISQQWANGMRPHETLLLQAMLEHPDNWEEAFDWQLRRRGIELEEQTWICLKKQFLRQWLTGTGKNTCARARFLEEENGLHLSENFLEVRKSGNFRKACRDLIDFSLMRYENRYGNVQKEGWLCLNESYTYLDSFRLMDFPKALVPNSVGGYFDEKNTGQFPVYINYDKAEDIAASIAYEDHFDSPDHLIAFSKNNRTLRSSDMIKLQNADKNGMRIPLFVRKNAASREKQFTFLGMMSPDGCFEEIMMNEGKIPAVRIGYTLHTPVRSDIYTYLTSV